MMYDVSDCDIVTTMTSSESTECWFLHNVWRKCRLVLTDLSPFVFGEASKYKKYIAKMVQVVAKSVRNFAKMVQNISRWDGLSSKWSGILSKWS